MARQFHNVTAEQIAYVAQLQRSGDEAGALQAANEAATKGFDDQTRRLKRTWARWRPGRQDSTGIQIHVGCGAGYWSPGSAQRC
ncbi:phage tail tape measure protein [Escherichia coli]|nr:phage tail tape measure protein [Escherichia coli]